MIYLDYAATTPVDPRVVEKMTASGIHIPTEAQYGSEKRSEGTILSVGDKVDKERFKIGDKVLFGNNSESDFSRYKQQYYLIRQAAIVAKLSYIEESEGSELYVFGNQ